MKVETEFLLTSHSFRDIDQWMYLNGERIEAKDRKKEIFHFTTAAASSIEGKEKPFSLSSTLNVFQFSASFCRQQKKEIENNET